MDKTKIARELARELNKIDLEKFNSINISKVNYKKILDFGMNQTELLPKKVFFREYLIKCSDLLILVKEPKASRDYCYGTWGIVNEILIYKTDDDGNNRVFIGCALLYKNFYRTKYGLFQFLFLFKNKKVTDCQAKRSIEKAKRILISFHKALAVGIIKVPRLYGHSYYVQKN